MGIVDGKLAFYSVQHAQAGFMDMITETEPACFSSLCCAEGLELYTRSAEGLLAQFRGDGSPEHWEHQQRLRDYIRRWRMRWHLHATDHAVDLKGAKINAREWRKALWKDRNRSQRDQYGWFDTVAERTLAESKWAIEDGKAPPTSFVRPDADDWVPIRLPSELRFHGHTVTIDILATRLDAMLMTDDGRCSLLYWDQTLEPRDQAEKRLMSTIRTAMDVVELSRFKMEIERRHMVWAIQYQLMNKDHGEIATLAGVKRETVTKAVNQVLGLVEVRPRQASVGKNAKGWKKRHTHATTVYAREHGAR